MGSICPTLLELSKIQDLVLYSDLYKTSRTLGLYSMKHDALLKIERNKECNNSLLTSSNVRGAWWSVLRMNLGGYLNIFLLVGFHHPRTSTLSHKVLSTQIGHPYIKKIGHCWFKRFGIVDCKNAIQDIYFSGQFKLCSWPLLRQL